MRIKDGKMSHTKVINVTILVNYVVFDAPAVNKPFEERMDFLKNLMRDLKHLKHIDLVEQEKCKGRIGEALRSDE